MRTIETLKADPEFHALPVSDQIRLARAMLDQDLALDSDFSALPGSDQDKIKSILASKAATFLSPELEGRMANVGDGYIQGRAGMGKMLDTFGSAAFSSSGVLGFTAGVLQGQEATKDRERVLDYYRELDRLSGRSDWAAAAGAVVGTLADVAAVSAVMSPLTGAAAKAVGVAARGGQAAIDAAAAAGKTAAIMKPILNILGPIATESVIEAVPYYVLSEQVNIQQGKPTALSQGAGEVALTLGGNAALDFFVGTAATAALLGLGRAGKAIFSPRKNPLLRGLSPAEESDILQQVEVGAEDDVLFQQYSSQVKAATIQSRDISAFLNKGVANVDLDVKGRDALLSRNLGQIPDLADDGVSPAMWIANPEGRYTKVAYQSQDHLENELSYTFFKSLQDLQHEDLTKKVRPENMWAYRRGKLVAEQKDFISAAKDPALAKVAPTARNALSKAEADSLTPLQGKVAVQARIELTGPVVENTNAGFFPFIQGLDTYKVTPHDMPNSVFIGVSPVPDEIYQGITPRAEELAASGAFKSVDAARGNLLLNRGYDYYAAPDGTFEFFIGRNAKLISDPTTILSKVDAKTLSGTSAAQTIFAKEARGAFSPEGFKANDDAILAGAAKVSKTQSYADAQNFSKLYLTSVGDTSNVRVTFISPLERAGARRISPTVVDVRIPRGISTFKEQEAFIRDLMDGLKQVSHSTPTPARIPGGNYFAAKLKANPAKFGFADLPDVGDWIQHMSAKLNGRITRDVKGMISVELPSGLYHFDTEADAATWLSRHAVDPDLARKELWSQGVNAKKLPDGTFAAAHSGSKTPFATATTWDALLDKLDYTPSKLDFRYAPDDIEITPEGFSFTLNGKRVFKTPSQARAYLSKYTDTKEAATFRTMKAASGNTLSVNPEGTYRVEIPKWGIVEHFDDAREARLFLEREITTAKEVEALAHKKGLDFSVEKGQYTLRDKGTTFRVGSLEELQPIMAKYPDLDDSLPSLVHLDPEVEQETAKLVGAFKKNYKFRAGANPFNLPPEFPATERIKEMSSWMSFRAFTSEFYGWLQDVAKRTNNPHLVSWANNFKLANRRAQIDQQRVAVYLDNVFMSSSGKLMPVESRRKVFYYGGGTQGTEESLRLREMAFKRYGIPQDFTLNAEEQVAAAKMKSFYQALGRKFNIDYEKLIYDYMPRLREIRDHVSSEEINQFAFAEDLVKKVPEWANGKPPKEISFWAEKSRLDELPEFWLKDDALEVALLYSSQGHKKFYFNPVWKDVDRLKTATKMEDALVNRLDAFRMDVMGTYHSPGEKIIENFGAKAFKEAAEFLNRRGIKVDTGSFSDVGRNLLRNTLALGQWATMGWKPFLAIRNSFQIYTTLAPRFGIDWTQAAAVKVLKDPESIYTRLRALGVISEKPPVVNALYSPTSFAGKVSTSAFGWFKNSDDLTRAIAYTAGDLRFQNAVNAMRFGQIKTADEFFAMSGLSRLEPTTASEIFKLVDGKWTDEGVVAAATDKFANIVQKETMFDYSGATSPMYARGVPGKFFGQYGTFSAAFRGHLASMCKYGSKKEIATSIATYLALTAGLGAGFQALRVRTNDFIPVAPAIFTGGPEFDLLLNGVKALDTGFEGAQARAALLRDAPTMVPGAAQFKYAGKTIDYLKQGDTYAALLSATMVPITPAP